MNRVTIPIHTASHRVGNERYIVVFDDQHRAEALRTLGRWASNPDLNMNWYDAASLSQEIRATIGELRVEQ